MERRLEELETVVAPTPSVSAGAPQQPTRLPRHRSGYSRFVRLMKYALPVIAGIVVVLVVIWPELKSQPDQFQIGISDLNVETAGGQRVIDARFTGVDGNNRPFSVTAATAIQAPGSKERVDLAEPKADVTLQAESWVAITSPTGVYWRDQEILDLTGGVELFHDEGYEFQTEVARIEFKSGNASGDQPVAGRGPFGTINSQGFRILQNGDRILFTGKARMILYPKQAPKGSGK